MSTYEIDWDYVWIDLFPALFGVLHRTILATVVGFRRRHRHRLDTGACQALSEPLD